MGSRGQDTRQQHNDQNTDTCRGGERLPSALLQPLHGGALPSAVRAPGAPAPVVQARSEDEFDLIEDAKEARYLINFEAFQRVSGSFVADAGATVPTTITGVASFYQNPFTGQNS